MRKVEPIDIIELERFPLKIKMKRCKLLFTFMN